MAKAFYELWPDQKKRPALRLTAIMVIGTLRFVKDTWRSENAARPLIASARPRSF